METARALAEMVGLGANGFLVPIALLLFKIQGRLSKVEGQLSQLIKED